MTADHTQAASPPGLERITTRYSAEQDRIRLAGELPGGEPVVLWLTQRLLRRLLPSLLAWLEEQGGTPNVDAETGAGTARALYSEALQGFAQQAARAQLEPQAPVRVPEGSPACLVQSVDVGRQPGGLYLAFRDTQRAVAAMALQPQPLRQWLNILYDAWRQAGWPLEVWPDWLHESAPDNAAQPGGVVH